MSSSSSDQEDALEKINKSLEEIKQLLNVSAETSKFLGLTWKGTKMSSSSSDQEDALEKINKSLEEIKQLLNVSAETSKAKFEEDNKYTVSICMEIIAEMKDHFRSYDETYFVVMKSFEKKGWREIFVKMSYEQRKRWIQILNAEENHRKTKLWNEEYQWKKMNK